MNVKAMLITPALISILSSLASGYYHFYRLKRSGMIIEHFKHSVYDEWEKKSYIAVSIGAYLIAGLVGPLAVLFVTLIILMGLIEKMKMAQDITVSDQGVLIRGVYEKWTKIKRVEIISEGVVRVKCKRSTYDISKMENKEVFISLSKEFITTEWFYATDEENEL